MMSNMAHPESTEPGAVTVAALTDTGPRKANEDRMSTAVSDDGSWVIAVADGLGGHARGDEAAQAAVDGLPERIGSAADMAMAFAEADQRVLALSRVLREENSWVAGARIPMSTLCVAAWTPEGGLLIGWMGDTMPFVVRCGPEGYTGSCCGRPHRGPFGGIEACLGQPPEDWGPGAGAVDVEIVDGFDDSDLPDAVIIASDGAWEPLAIEYGDAEWLWDDSPAGIGSACNPGAADASGIAESVLANARGLGLNDNATVAVAHWRRALDP
jgi:hypothetical protein